MPRILLIVLHVQNEVMATALSVVNHEFDNQQLEPEKKDDLSSFADLRLDPKASFPPSFTICSTIMTSKATTGYLAFFALLGQNDTNYLGACFDGQRMDGFAIKTGTYGHMPKRKIPQVFPEQWLSSCIAIDTETGLLQWVVDSHLVENITLEGIIHNAPNHPADLSGRLTLGALNSGPGRWKTYSNRVTLLNIFSSPLSIERMQKMTSHGGERCSAHGDYLSWDDMQWSFYGSAAQESWTSEEVCSEENTIDLFSSSFAGIEGCAHHCTARNWTLECPQ